MKKGSTLFLRGVVCLMGLGVLGLSALTLPAIGDDDYTTYLPLILALYAATVPILMAAYQTLKLLGYIDSNQAFSDLSVQALRRIKQCAVAVGGLGIISLPFLYIRAELDDAPGLAAIGLMVIFAATVVAVFAAVMQSLLQSAIDIKSENDLTV